MPKSKVKKKNKKSGKNQGDIFNTNRLVQTKTKKMSEIILEFAEPLLEEASDMQKGESAIAFSVIVWNLSLMPLEEQEKQKEYIIKEFSNKDKSFTKDMVEIMEILLERKNKYFSNVRRLVVNYEVGVTNEQLHLQVTSTDIS